jgi:hypothetical protein
MFRKRLTREKSLVKALILNKIDGAWFQEYRVKDIISRKDMIISSGDMIISRKDMIISSGDMFSVFFQGGRES